MKKRIPYSLYKTGYTDFPAEGYDKGTKTIEVTLPEYKKPRFPKSWKQSCNRYYTPFGFTVIVWNTGLAENFVVDTNGMEYARFKTFSAGLYARQQVIDYVTSLELKKA